VISNLIAAIKTQVETATSFSELGLVIGPENNAKLLSRDRYGVLPGEASQVEGSIRYYTIDQVFTVSLMTDYVKLKSDDTGKRTATNTLFDKGLDVYEQVLKTKAGLPNSVMNVKGLTISEPLYFANEDTVLINVSFILTYRKPI